MLVACRAGEEELPGVVECVLEGRTRTPHYRLLNRPEISIFPEGMEPNSLDDAFFPEPECILGDTEVAHAPIAPPAPAPVVDRAPMVAAHAPSREAKKKAPPPALVTLRGLRMQRRIYECQYCSLDFPALDLVVEHIARAHPVGLNCPICNEKFCDADALEQHRKDKHWRVNSTPLLAEASTKAENDSAAAAALDSKQEEEDASDSEDNSKMDAFTRLPDGFQCNECNVIFPRELSYQQHICYPATSNRCKRCKLSFGTHLALVRHISMVHGNPNAQKSKFNCNVCGAKFAHEVSFQRHLQAHVAAA